MTASDGSLLVGLYESVAGEDRWIGGEAPVSAGWADRVVAASVGRDDAAMLLAYLDGTAVGWISFSREGDVVDLGMGVIDGYRSRGIGTAMMEAALTWAESVGAAQVRLEVFPHNDRAIGLYRKFGFAEVERRVGAHQRRNGEFWDSLTMVLRLRAN
jgi:ribosomal protein S18 acetylase RimI-like enzyme